MLQKFLQNECYEVFSSKSLHHEFQCQNRILMHKKSVHIPMSKPQEHFKSCDATMFFHSCRVSLPETS